jgi:hypothetical protein
LDWGVWIGEGRAIAGRIGRSKVSTRLVAK